MKMGDGGYRPAYNVQLATDTATQIITGVDVVTTGGDQGQLAPMVEQHEQRYQQTPEAMLVDGGFVKKEAIEQVSPPAGGTKAGEDRRSGQQVVADGSDGVNVGSGVDLVGLGNRLRRRIERGSGHRVGTGEVRVLLAIEGLDQSEVEDFHEIVQPAAAGEEDVRRFNVAMHQSGRVRLGQRPANLPQNIDQPWLRAEGRTA